MLCLVMGQEGNREALLCLGPDLVLQTILQKVLHLDLKGGILVLSILSPRLCGSKTYLVFILGLGWEFLAPLQQ